MIIGLTGFKQSGKDTIADILVRRGFAKKSFADPLRAMAAGINPLIDIGEGVVMRYNMILETIGYEEAKRLFPDFRLFLQRLGTEGGRKCLGENVWVDALDRTLPRVKDIVVADCRFPNEAAWIRSKGYLWRVNRTGQVNTDLHESEIYIPTLDVDAEIENDGTLAELEEKADSLYTAYCRMMIL